MGAYTTYTIVMLILAIVMVVVLLWLVTRHTTRFLLRRLREAQAQEYREFQHGLHIAESPMELEFFVLKYPDSIYCEHALFEIGEKYFHAKRYHLAWDAYQRFMNECGKSFHADVARARLDEIEKISG